MFIKWKLLFLCSFVLTFWYQAVAGVFSNAEKQFENYGGSDYLQKSIIRHNDAGYPIKEEAFKELKKMQATLTDRKSSDAMTLEDAIVENGLFAPSLDLWFKLKNDPDIEKILQEDFSLKTVLAVALKNNPKIQSEYKLARASLERYDQVSNLDEIMNQYASFTKDLEINIGNPMLLNRPLMMNFPFPGMLALKGDIVMKDIQVSALELKKTVQDIVVSTRQAYYELSYLADAIKITDGSLKIIQKMKDAVNSLYISGKVSMNDIVKIQMEIEKLQNKIESLDQEKKTAQLTLNKLMGINGNFTPSNTDELKPYILAFKKSELLQKSIHNRVDILILSKQLERMNLMIKMAEKEFYPDFTVGFSVFQNRIEKPAFSAMPMVRSGNWFGKNDAYIRETKIRYNSKKDMLEDLKNTTETMINETLFKYENAQRFFNLYDSKLVPESQMAVDISTALYVNRKIGFVDLMSSQELFLKYSLQLKESVKNMNVELAKIERLLGEQLSQTFEKGER